MAFAVDPVKYNNVRIDLDELLWEKGRRAHEQARMAYVEEQVEEVDERILEHAKKMGEKNSKKFKSGLETTVQDLSAIAAGQKKRLTLKMIKQKMSLQKGWNEMEKYAEDDVYYVYKQNKFYEQIDMQ